MSILNYEFKADALNIEVVDDILELILTHHKIDWYRHFCFAAHELIINSIEAMINNSLDNNTICIKLNIDIDHVSFSITDSAGGLPIEVTDCLSEDKSSSMDSHGRGLFMINSLVDDFIFQKEGTGKFTYTIIKNRIITIESEDIINGN